MPLPTSPATTRTKDALVDACSTAPMPPCSPFPSLPAGWSSPRAAPAPCHLRLAGRIWRRTADDQRPLCCCYKCPAGAPPHLQCAEAPVALSAGTVGGGGGQWIRDGGARLPAVGWRRGKPKKPLFADVHSTMEPTFARGAWPSDSSGGFPSSTRAFLVWPARGRPRRTARRLDRILILLSSTPRRWRFTLNLHYHAHRSDAPSHEGPAAMPPPPNSAQPTPSSRLRSFAAPPASAVLADPARPGAGVLVGLRCIRRPSSGAGWGGGPVERDWLVQHDSLFGNYGPAARPPALAELGRNGARPDAAGGLRLRQTSRPGC
jgi:hypothetical protein